MGHEHHQCALLHPDALLAGPGRDTVVARSGSDTVNGGPGLDCATIGRAHPTLVSSEVCPQRK